MESSNSVQPMETMQPTTRALRENHSGDEISPTRIHTIASPFPVVERASPPEG